MPKIINVEMKPHIGLISADLRKLHYQYFFNCSHKFHHLANLSPKI